jgi:hypothetical protein
MSKFLVICDGAVYQNFHCSAFYSFCFALSFYLCALFCALLCCVFMLHCINRKLYLWSCFGTKLDNTGGARPFKNLNVSSAIVLILLICCVGIFALISSKFS